MFKTLWIFACLFVIFYLSYFGAAQSVFSTNRRKTSNICKGRFDCPDNAYCENYSAETAGYCVCIDDYIMIDYNKTRGCLKVATEINDGCLVNQQCQATLSTDAECLYGTCQCQYGTHYVSHENACYKTAKINEICSSSNNCVVEGTICDIGKCVCQIGMHPDTYATRCLKNIELGQKCTRNEECIAENARCNEICRCKMSHILNAEKNLCLKVAQYLGDECVESEQCTCHLGNTMCKVYDDGLGNCTCRSGYHLANNKCWLSIGLSEICEYNENCANTANSICASGRCACVDGLSEINGRCSRSSVLIGFPLLFLFIFNMMTQISSSSFVYFI